MGFRTQEYWRGLLFPSPEDLLDPGTESTYPIPSHWQADSLSPEPPRKPLPMDEEAKIHRYKLTHPGCTGQFFQEEEILGSLYILKNKYLFTNTFLQTLCPLQMLSIINISLAFSGS